MNVLLGGIISARLGLWLTDLSVTQIIQEGVQEEYRGTIGELKFLLVIYTDSSSNVSNRYPRWCPGQLELSDGLRQVRLGYHPPRRQDIWLARHRLIRLLHSGDGVLLILRMPVRSLRRCKKTRNESHLILRHWNAAPTDGRDKDEKEKEESTLDQSKLSEVYSNSDRT